MAVTLTTAARNAACNATTALVNGGTVQLRTAAEAVVATLSLSATAFAAAVTGAAAANAITPAATTAAGTVTIAVFRNSGGTEIWRCSVSATGGGGDIVFTSNVFGLGDTADITAYTHTQPA